jgi:1-acyl-sn-glycerol-3-phosphate acyltransferase
VSALPRRLLTVPAVLAATTLMTVAAPLWFLAAVVAGALLPAARSAPRVLAFITAFLWCETLGILASAWIWLRHGRAAGGPDAEPWLAANYALQSWWCGALKRSAQALFRLRFEVEGADVLGGDGVLMMLRHCSIGDTMIPIVFYADARDRRLRFVLKRELLLDPCLDIVGNRLPNYFADRSATDTDREVEGVRALTADLGVEEGVLIYPEGTRFTPAKRAAVLRRLEEKGRTDALERARGRPNLLPPRPGGPLGLLAANPGRDVVFCAHTGFEGSADFARLFNGSWLDTVVRIRFWRVPYAEIPEDDEGRRRFLDAQWDRMSAEVADLAGR